MLTSILDYCVSPKGLEALPLMRWQLVVLLPGSPKPGRVCSESERLGFPWQIPWFAQALLETPVPFSLHSDFEVLIQDYRFIW